jgi:hypothetical protein
VAWKERNYSLGVVEEAIGREIERMMAGLKE